ncbi:MAG TPA: polyhydroxyalkanoic acid system family protein [Pseudomonadales bacterium]
MSTVHFKKAFTMNLEDVRHGIEQLGQGLQKEHGLKYHWEGQHKAVFQHKAAKGHIAIKGNEIQLELKLGLMYAAMAPLIKSRIAAMADQYIS